MTDWGSQRLIGNVRERYEQVKDHGITRSLEGKEYEWHSFYTGWLEGRLAMLWESHEQEMRKVLKDMEWTGFHTDYEDSWGVMTIACPCCRNAKSDGHKENCELKKLIG
jgi:hypothetical protein